MFWGGYACRRVCLRTGPSMYARPPTSAAAAHQPQAPHPAHLQHGEGLVDPDGQHHQARDVLAQVILVGGEGLGPLLHRGIQMMSEAGRRCSVRGIADPPPAAPPAHPTAAPRSAALRPGRPWPPPPWGPPPTGPRSPEHCRRDNGACGRAGERSTADGQRRRAAAKATELPPGYSRPWAHSIGCRDRCSVAGA